MQSLPCHSSKHCIPQKIQSIKMIMTIDSYTYNQNHFILAWLWLAFGYGWWLMASYSIQIPVTPGSANKSL